MKSEKELKEIVRQKYGEIASTPKSSGCCGPCGCSTPDEYSFVTEDYTTQEGYYADADLNLGCGLPTEHAGLKPEMKVVDLGSGAGNDVFIARRIVGETGFVIGVDMTESMNLLAERNRAKLGYENVEFRAGEIEDLPLADKEVDAVISNCVLNLVPDKVKAFSEMHRVLNTGGHFCISDIVLRGELHSALKEVAELYSGCVAGAIQEKNYLDLLGSSGFENIEVKKRHEIQLPFDYVSEWMTKDEWQAFSESDNGIFSITVTGEKN